MTNLLLTILIPCLIQVESAGRADVMGDGGKSAGCLQVGAACIADVNRVAGTKYKWPADALNPHKARTICLLYLSHYGAWYERKTGRKADAEVLARVWNGGPYGWRKTATLPYWKKVEKELLTPRTRR